MGVLVPELVIKGGRVIDQDGERTADVAIDDGRIVEVGPDLDDAIVVDGDVGRALPVLIDDPSTLDDQLRHQHSHRYRSRRRGSRRRG